MSRNIRGLLGHDPDELIGAPLPDYPSSYIGDIAVFSEANTRSVLLRMAR